MVKKILIIDDEIKLRRLLGRILEQEGFVIVEAGDFKSAIKLLEHDTFPVILSDVRLPDGNGVDNIPLLIKHAPNSKIILLTAYGNIPDGVQAVKNGAYDYITKGDDNDRIIPLVNSAFDHFDLTKKITQLDNLQKKYNGGFQNIIGQSPVIKQAISLAIKVAPTDATVLLLGETGTGKEVFARSIHKESNRSGKNFVALNCSTFSQELMESELFGHVSGAFTSASKDQKGLVEEASGGTLFWDEIGELPLTLQAKLLRLLESKEYFRVGDTKTQKADFRLVAATNKNLEEECLNGNFRRDLFYRLNIFSVVLPPLRERSNDILLLVNALLKELSNKIDYTISEEYLTLLQQWNWPGNIRELRNVLERSVILSNESTLSIETLPLNMIAQTQQTDTKIHSAFSMSSIEKRHIQKVLNYTKGNKAEAARLLEIGTATLYRKIDEYKI